MSAVSPPLVNFGWKAPDFHLPDTHGKIWTRDSLRGPKGLVLVFMCNHCPYVQAIVDKMVKDFRALHDLGYGAAGICSNDPALAPGDGFTEMGAFARKHHLPFPYLHDVTKGSPAPTTPPARPTSTASTPSSASSTAAASTTRGATRSPATAASSSRRCARWPGPAQGPREPVQAIGCSIKWKAA